MKKLLFTFLSVGLLSTFNVIAQDYNFPDESRDLYVRAGFELDYKQESHVFTTYKLERDLTTGIYHVAVELEREHIGVIEKGDPPVMGNRDYEYNVVFEGKETEDDAGSIRFPNHTRPFNLLDFTSEEKAIVNFYAKLTPMPWNPKDGGGYDEETPRIMYICDAQNLIFADVTNTSAPLPLPDQSGYMRHIIQGSGGKYEYSLYTISSGGEWQRMDVVEGLPDGKDTKNTHLLPNGGYITGRFQFTYHYPTLTLSVDKMIDAFSGSAITVNGEEKELENGLGEFGNELLLGGTLKTYVSAHQELIDYENVSVKLFYIINDLEVQSLDLAVTNLNDGEAAWKAELNILEDLALENGEHTLKLWFETNYLHDTLTDDNDGNYYTTTFTLDTSLRDSGDPSNPVLSGNWDAEAFEALDLNYAGLTTIDFTRVSGLTELPEMEDLNPNCLIYVNATVSGIKDNNVVVFEDGTGIAENIVLTEGRYFHNSREFTATSIEYTRDFSAMNGWASICLPFTPDNSADFVCRTLKEVITEEGTTTLVFSLIEGDMEANTPYLIEANGSTPDSFVAENKVIPVTTIEPVVKGKYAFTGNYIYKEAEEVEGSCYFLNQEGTAFGIASTSSYINAFRAYVYTTDDNPAPSLAVKHDEDDNDDGTTGIESSADTDQLVISSHNGILSLISSQAVEVNIYAIDGRLVKKLLLKEGENTISDLSNGIYILNNQKVIIK